MGIGKTGVLCLVSLHWLRHTGISDDVKIRPKEHVRDDAGHSSSAITDKYVDIELRERHRSAKAKSLNYNCSAYLYCWAKTMTI